MTSTPNVVSRRRARSASRERDGDDDEDDDRQAATMRRLANARPSRRRDLSPRPRSMSDMAHKELCAAIPSLQEHGAELESVNKRIFVRTLVKKKPEWTYGEIHALSRTTVANNRVSVCWDMEHGSLILDWWAAERPRRDLGAMRRGAPPLSTSAVSLSREVLDAIKGARCDDKVYLLVINAVTLLYQVQARTTVPTAAQMQGDESPRNLKFAVRNGGARIDITTSGWKRMLLSDLEMLRVRPPPPPPHHQRAGQTSARPGGHSPGRVDRQPDGGSGQCAGEKINRTPKACTECTCAVVRNAKRQLSAAVCRVRRRQLCQQRAGAGSGGVAPLGHATAVW